MKWKKENKGTNLNEVTKGANSKTGAQQIHKQPFDSKSIYRS